MKKIFAIVSAFVVAVIIGFACKKSTTTSTSTTTTTGTTTSSTSGTTTSGTTTVANSVTLTTSSGPVTGSVTSSSCGSTYMYGTTNVPTQIGQIAVSFSAAPSAGNYNVVVNSPNSTQALVSVGGNYATSGSITISVSGGKNKVAFNNVTCSTSPTYTLNGNFSCP